MVLSQKLIFVFLKTMFHGREPFWFSTDEVCGNDDYKLCKKETSKPMKYLIHANRVKKYYTHVRNYKPDEVMEETNQREGRIEEHFSKKVTVDSKKIKSVGSSLNANLP